MEEQIIKLLRRRKQSPVDIPALVQALGLKPSQKPSLKRTLLRLEQSGQVARIKGNRFILPGEADLVPGRIQMTIKGRGFLIPDEESLPEIEIPATETGTALHEDRVLVRREVDQPRRRGSDDDRQRGSVVRVLERRRTQFVGELKRGRRFLSVIPDEPRIHCDFVVPGPRDLGRPARAGDKVVVELIDWTSRHTHAEAEIVEVLGPPTKEGVDMLSILRQYELPTRFPRNVLSEVKRLGTKVKEKDLVGRTDCRSHSVITIDPMDAKDFDDAFYLKPLRDGSWRLWVHIADVSHYVSPGTLLDREAKKRGNSTYLVDRVIPMLPEALSNELCSLKPNVDRLTKCVEFTLSADGVVKRSRVYGAVIHSQRRFTYEEALSTLESKPKTPIETMLHQANRLAQKVRRRRFQAGALALDFPENKIYLNDKGGVDRIVQTENDISHQLIEEFMLLANEAVAAKLRQRRKGTIYRIHEAPDPKKLREYRDEVLAHNIPCGNLEKPVEVQKLLRRLAELSVGKALKIGFLRSLMRARYATQPLGHYGLAKADYAHFTSPIRRYADLVVHRSLFGEGRQPQLKETAEHISLTERNSADAERDSHRVKLFAYLTEQLKSNRREAYEGVVIEIRNFGFFVDVSALGLSGLVPFSEIENEFFRYHRERRVVIGERSGRQIGIGDTVEVEVAKVDTFKKQVDFRLRNSGKKQDGRRKRNQRKSDNHQKTQVRKKQRRWKRAKR